MPKIGMYPCRPSVKMSVECENWISSPKIDMMRSTQTKKVKEEREEKEEKEREEKAIGINPNDKTLFHNLKGRLMQTGGIRLCI